jgi:hypothetical protein
MKRILPTSDQNTMAGGDPATSRWDPAQDQDFEVFMTMNLT